MAFDKRLLYFRELRITAAILLVTCAGCKASRLDADRKGITVTSNVQLKSYVHFAVGANGHKETRLWFPLLQVYDEEGRLVYVSHDANANAIVLGGFPNNVATFKPISEATPLLDVMRELPEFDAKRKDLLQSKRATILSVFLEECHACSVQEEALDDTQKRLHNQGVNLLVVRVSKPA